MRHSFNQHSRAFLKDSRGNFTMMFALTAPIIALCIAGGMDFSNMVSEEQKAQSAADSAALAATTAMINSLKTGPALTVQQAEAVATQYFSSNAPTNVISGETTFTPVTTYSSSTGIVTTAVAYTGSIPTLMGAVGGVSSHAMNISATSTATITTTVTNPTGTATGSGWIAEDPVVYNATTGSNFMDMCDVTHATWYNILSDAKFEINANCDGVAGEWAELYKIDVLAASHVISFTPSLVSVLWSPGLYINREVWTGAVTVDGTSYAAPSAAGTTTVLSDTANGVTVKIVVGQPGVSGSAANYALITTPNYSTTVAYDSDDDGSYNLGFASINFAATNAGACAAPGGLWGQTLTGGQDTNAQDFALLTATSTASQFSKTCAVTTTSSSTTTLVQ